VLVLFAYPVTAFVAGADWSRLLRATLVPSMPQSRDEWSTLVAILGPTWMASRPGQELEAGKGVLHSHVALDRRGCRTGLRGLNLVKALYWTAIINGLLAPFLLIAILVVASDKKLMQGQPSSRLGWTIVALATVAMFAAGVAMFVV
jgi:Mn2+/Fe2+ NRAMP family transporter